jgi:hypothetical protein
MKDRNGKAIPIFSPGEMIWVKLFWTIWIIVGLFLLFG